MPCSGCFPPTYLPIALHFEVDGRILGFTALVAVGTGVLFGLVPAWHATRTGLAQSLKAGGRDGAGTRGGHRLRQSLVVAEIAAALVLLVGMTLCTRSFERARLVQVGFEPQGVWIAGFRLPPGAYSPAEAAAFYRRLRLELAQLPGVAAVGLTDWIPLGFEGGSSTGFSVPGYQPGPSEHVEAGVSVVTPGYFSALRVPFAAGREFDERDGPEAPPVVIINQRLADRYFPGRDPVGLKLNLWDKPRTIVGVTRTGKYRSLNEPPRSYLFLPVEQIGDHTLAAVIRTTVAPGSVASAVEQTALRLDPAVKPMAAMPLTDYMAAAYLIPQTAAVLLTVLGSIALLLAALGIYAVIAWSVGRRVREVGVRMALGASRPGMIWMFVREGLRLAGLGAALGLVGALLGGRLLGSLLVDVSAGDPLTYLLAIPTLALVTAFACWLPARRAARVDPMTALRTE
jgi:predicted permease